MNVGFKRCETTRTIVTRSFKSSGQTQGVEKWQNPNDKADIMSGKNKVRSEIQKIRQGIR